MMRFIWITYFLMGMWISAWSQSTPHNLFEEAVINLKLEKASEIAIASDSRYRDYYISRVAFYRYLIREDPLWFNSFMSASKLALSNLEKLPESEPEKKAMIAEIQFLRGAAKLLDKKYLGAVIDLKSACDNVYSNSKSFSNNPEQMKLLGIYNVVMTSVPRKLQWLGNALCFKGDLNLGMKQLDMAAKESKLLPAEAEIIAFYFEKNLLSDPLASYNRVKRLVQAYPDSPLFRYFLVSSLIDQRKTDEALDVLAKGSALFEKPGVSGLPIWDYTHAKALYFKTDYKQAVIWFDKFLEGTMGTTLVADALFRKGMSLLLSGDYEASRKVFHQLNNIEHSMFDEDEYASFMASIYLLHEPDKWDKQLHGARNLFDGGYYDESIQMLKILLDNESQLNENQRTELFYRMGRNCHSRGEYTLAEEWYSRSGHTSPGHGLWMKVYSFYYLGKLHEERGNKEKARFFYKQALSYDDYFYQAGLEQRCKAALHKMKG